MGVKGITLPACLSFPLQLLSGSEDSFVEVWGLTHNPDTDDIEVSEGWGAPLSHSFPGGGAELPSLPPRVLPQPGQDCPLLTLRPNNLAACLVSAQQGVRNWGWI